MTTGMSDLRDADSDPLGLDSESNPYEAPKARIKREPRGPAGPPVAGRGQRWAAQFINQILAGLSAIPIFVLYRGYGFDDFMATRAGELTDLDPYKWFGIALIPWFLLNAYLIHTRSQSVGKMVVKIKVVGMNGGPAGTLKQLFVRWGLVFMTSQVIPFFGLLDALLIFRKSNKCLHDNLAGTMVVDVPREPRQRVRRPRSESTDPAE